MIARYAVYDTLTDRDIREFDDLPDAYTEVDRLVQRHGKRYAVRTAREHRERVKAATVVDFLPVHEPAPATSPAPDTAQFGERIARVLEAIKHLATAVERLDQDLIEIKVALALHSAAESIAKQSAGDAPEAIEVIKLGKTASHVLGRGAPISTGSHSPLLTDLHELLEELTTDDLRGEAPENLNRAPPQKRSVTPQQQSAQWPDLTTRDGITTAYRSGTITREQAAAAMVAAGFAEQPE
jgi:hypothetical protein